jgi:hypothetical protein
MFCRCFSFVRDFLVFDNLPLIEAGEAGFLDSRDNGQTHLVRRPSGAVRGVALASGEIIEGDAAVRRSI